MIAAGLGVIAADDVRRRRAEQQQCMVLGAAELGHIARMVARRALGLIGVLLLLVNDEQAEILHGCKDRAARADDNAREARADALPLVIALRERQTAVQDGNRVAEIGGNASIICGVSEISGTSRIAPCPAASACAIRCR